MDAGAAARPGLGEFGAAAAALAVAGLIALSPATGAPVLAPAAVAGAVGWIAWRDARDFIIPDGATLALCVLALAIRLAAEGFGTGALIAVALDAGLAGGALWAVREVYYRLRGVDGLGFGDVKLAAASAILVGASGFAFALFAAALAGLAVAALRRGAGEGRIAFGALLAPAVWAIWMAGLSSAPY